MNQKVHVKAIRPKGRKPKIPEPTRARVQLMPPFTEYKDSKTGKVILRFKAKYEDEIMIVQEIEGETKIADIFIERFQKRFQTWLVQRIKEHEL